MKEFGRHRARRGIASINVVPYIDVMLVLLIIFMVMPHNQENVVLTEQVTQLQVENLALQAEVQKLKKDMAAAIEAKNKELAQVKEQSKVKEPPKAKAGIVSFGLWIQYAEVGGRWEELGRFRLERMGDGAFRMVAISQSYLAAQTYSIRDVRFDENSGVWSFNSDLGANMLVNFELRRTAEGMFEGWSSMHGVRRNHNLWKKIAD